MQGDRVQPDAIQIILASAHSDDGDALQSLLTGSPWELIVVANVADAIRALHQITVPIVLCDQHLDGQPWQETIRALIKTRRRSSVTLLADLGGPRLYAEVARRGGFDLLERPFDKEQVYATLLCAYARGRTSWPLLSHRRVTAAVPA